MSRTPPLRALSTLLLLVLITAVTSQQLNVTRRKRQSPFNANDLIGLLSNLASQSGVGGGGGGGLGSNFLQQLQQQSPVNQQGGFGGLGASLLQQLQQQAPVNQQQGGFGGLGGLGASLLQQLQQQAPAAQPAPSGGLADGVAQFLAGFNGQPAQGPYPGPYGGQGQYGQGQYPQQQPYPGGRPGRPGPGPGGYGQYPGRPGGPGGYPGQYPGGQGPYPGPGGPGLYPGPGRPGLYPGQGGPGLYGQGGPGLYPAPNPNGAASFTEALSSIAQYDDLRCVPRLLCEVASGGRPDYSGKQDSILPFISRDALLNLLTVFNFADTSPLFAFGRAALLGITTRGSPNGCFSAYPTCPRDPDTLVNYLNNHNGGFFRFFSRQQQQPQYAPQYAPQQQGYYQPQPLKGQNGPQQGYYQPQSQNGIQQGYYQPPLKGQNGYQQGYYDPVKGQKYGVQQYNPQKQKGNKYGYQQGYYGQQNDPQQQKYGYQQQQQYAQQYAPQYSGQYGLTRVQKAIYSPSNQVSVTAKPYKQTTKYESFPPYADRYATTPRYEESSRPKGTPLRFPRSEEDMTAVESRILYEEPGKGFFPSKTRKAKGFSFPGVLGDGREVVPVPMVFPDRTGTGDLRLDTDDYGKAIIYSVSETGFKEDRFRAPDVYQYGKKTKLFRFPEEDRYYGKHRDSKSIKRKKTIRFPNKYEEASFRSASREEEEEIVAEDVEEGDEEDSTATR